MGAAEVDYRSPIRGRRFSTGGLVMAGRVACISELELHKLLTDRATWLRAYIDERIPARFRTLVDPEDVLQEVWSGAFRSLGEYRTDQPGAFDHWLKGITQHKLADALRNAGTAKRGGARVQVQARPGRHTSFTDLLADLVSRGRTPSSEMSSQEAADAVQVALRRLKEPHRRAVYLRQIEGRSRAEIARTMQKSPAAVNSLLYQGLRELRVILGDARRFLSGLGTPLGR